MIMCEKIEFVWVNNGEDRRINNFLDEVDDILIPPLSERVNIQQYAKKLAQKAETIFACLGNQDIGSCSVYCNAEVAFISSFAIKPAYKRMKLGSNMMKRVMEYAKERMCESIQLEVNGKNLGAIAFYKKCGFACISLRDEWLIMECKL